MVNKQLVLAFFASEAEADAAVEQLKAWDKATKDIKLGAIGVLVKDEHGKVKTHKLGHRNTLGGAVFGVLAGIFSGGLTVVAGAVAGGVLGALYRQGLDLSKEDKARIEAELDGGRAAVGVLVEPEESPEVAAKLNELGGRAEAHQLSEETLSQAQAAAEEAGPQA